MKILTLEEQSRHIQRKIAEGVPIPDRAALVNSGLRRTQAKRDLLAFMKRRREEAGRPPVFEANF